MISIRKQKPRNFQTPSLYNNIFLLRGGIVKLILQNKRIFPKQALTLSSMISVTQDPRTKRLWQEERICQCPLLHLLLKTAVFYCLWFSLISHRHPIKKKNGYYVHRKYSDSMNFIESCPYHRKEDKIEKKQYAYSCACRYIQNYS